MSKRKKNEESSSDDENWLDDPELIDGVSLEMDWDPEMFQSDPDENDSFDDWDLTIENDLMTDSTSREPLEGDAVEPDEVDSPLLDIPSDWTETSDESGVLDSMIVLPWETEGEVEGESQSFVVRLDPSLSRSQWVTTKVTDNSPVTATLWVQGLRFDVHFERVKGNNELLVLGREVLEDRVLISIPKAH